MRHLRLVSAVLAISVLCSGCFGPFNLTRRLYQWNEQVGTKWEREFMFIVLVWVPVYGVAGLADAIVFNSMEFWTGKNPVDPPGREQSVLPTTTRIARGDAAAQLTYTPRPEGAQLLIEQFQQGRSAGSLRIEQRDGMAVGTDANGAVLLTARTLPDGRIEVRDGSGQQVARSTNREPGRK